MDKKSTKLDSLKKKQEQLKAQIQALEASESARERKRETRRKILVGAFYLEKAREESRFEDIVKRMDDYLNRDADRILFGLSPKIKSTDNH